MMKPYIFTIILFFVSTHVCALEKMTEPELKDTTAQLASVPGHVSDLSAPVTGLAGDIGPAIGPVIPVYSRYSNNSHHIDNASGFKENNDAVVAPIIKMQQVAGDFSALGGFF